MEKQRNIVMRINQVKREIAELGPMRSGSLSKQKRAWGKTYWHLSYTTGDRAIPPVSAKNALTR